MCFREKRCLLEDKDVKLGGWGLEDDRWVGFKEVFSFCGIDWRVYGKI